MTNAPVTPAPTGITVTAGMLDSAAPCVSGTASLIAKTATLWIFEGGNDDGRNPERSRKNYYVRHHRNSGSTGHHLLGGGLVQSEKGGGRVNVPHYWN